MERTCREGAHKVQSVEVSKECKDCTIGARDLHYRLEPGLNHPSLLIVLSKLRRIAFFPGVLLL
jgi:hypothetical protein